MTRRKGEYSKSRLDREFSYQVILPADRCTGVNGAAIEKLCRDLAKGPLHHSVVQHDEWHPVYASLTHRTPISFERRSAARNSILLLADAAGSGTCYAAQASTESLKVCP